MTATTIRRSSHCGTSFRLRKVLQDSEDKTKIEACSIGRQTPYALDHTEIDRWLQRLGDLQEPALAFESDDSLKELGQDRR